MDRIIRPLSEVFLYCSPESIWRSQWMLDEAGDSQAGSTESEQGEAEEDGWNKER